MAAVTATLAVAAPISSRPRRRTTGPTTTTTTTTNSSFLPTRLASLKSPTIVTFQSAPPDAKARRLRGFAVACLPSSPKSPSAVSTRLFVSGLSFRTTEESLRNAFQNFGELVEVNLVMDRIANRPRGFAFIRYATEEESKNAIEGMHGKFLDGRVIFVEVAKPRSELRKASKSPPKLY